MSIPYRDIAILLCATLLLLFNHPLLGIADTNAQFLGVPVLYLYLLAVWIIAIVALFRISRHLFTNDNPHE